MIRLSAEQRAACAELAGPVRIVAGAGTGKTAVIVERHRRLIASGVAPASILTMTFTERAASELRARVEASSESGQAGPVGTFHSVALALLREHGTAIGLRPGFRILTGPDRWISLRELMWRIGDPAFIGQERPDDLVAPLLRLQERLKQELVPLPRLAGWARSGAGDPERRAMLSAAARLFRAHAEFGRREGWVDFDDLITGTVRVLETSAERRAAISERVRWILVDEYQDANLAQERMVELLAGASGNVCVVGDDDQSIYRFRGASRASLERFAQTFPAAVTRTLGRNRRSGARIVAAAARLVETNPDRVPKPLSAASSRGPGRAPAARHHRDAADEAAAIARDLSALVEERGSGRGLAVLTRTHAIAAPITAALEAAGVRFVHRGGQDLFRRPEVGDAIAYLRLLHDPGDLLALARLLGRPPLSLPLAEALATVRAGDERPLVQLASRPPTEAWAGLVQELAGETSRLGVDELLFEVLERTRLVDALASPGGQESLRMAADLSRFADFVAAYCESRRDHSLSLFLDYLDLVLASGVDVAAGEPEDDGDAVQVLSIHQAKGLEFDAVFLPAIVEGRLPQPHRPDPLDLPAELAEAAVRGREDHVAEERRLCYVAVTRARERVVLSWADRYEGARRWRPSRFLEELGLEAWPVPLQPPREPAAWTPSEAVAVAAGVAAATADAAELEAEPELSFSGISAYRECPRRFWFRHRLRLPSAAAVEVQFGTIVHLALMRAGRMRQLDREVGPELLEELHREAWEQVGISDPRRRPALEALGRRMLGAYRERGGLDPRPAAVEIPFTTGLDGWSLRGIIDRIDGPPPPSQEGGGWVAGAPMAERGGRAWTIVDYKTGAPQPASRLRRDLQLALYALGARSLFGVGRGGGWAGPRAETPGGDLPGIISSAPFGPGWAGPAPGPDDPIELEIVYLREGRSVFVPATADLLDEARQIGAEVAAGVAAGRFEPNPERRRCGLCPYRLACDAAR